MKVLSLFDGISCARVALDQSGIPVEAYYASEIDKHAIEISKKNWPDILQLGDIKGIRNLKEINVDGYANPGVINVYQYKIPEIDLLIGGSPCQDLSIAGKRKGLAGERSGLFYEYLRIRDEVKPKYFILENVASMSKEAKEEISKCLGIEPIMINAALVSAQQRKRLFWVGKLVGDKYEQVYIDLPEDKNILLKDIIHETRGEKFDLEKYIIKASNLTWVKNPKTTRLGQFNKGGQGDRIYSTEGKSIALSALGGGRGAKTGLYLIVPEATKQGYAVAEVGDSVDLSFPNSSTRRGRVGKKAKNLMTSSSIGVVGNGYVRKLTPIECCRLQCIPDNTTEGFSDGKAYKATGNAFNADVISHILTYLK